MVRHIHFRTVAKLVTVLASFISFFATTARADSLLINGNFEEGPVIQPGFFKYTVQPGSTALTGWTVNGGAINVVTEDYWVPPFGHRSIELSNTGPGIIEQTFASTPGASYRVTFWISGEPGSSPAIKHLQVGAGALAQDFAFDSQPSWTWNMGWTQDTLEFVAAGTSTTVRFASMDTTDAGPALDSVAVELASAAPPPPLVLALAPMSPDPVRANGRLRFQLTTPGRATIQICDVQGRTVAVLADGEFGAGPHEVEFTPHAIGARSGLYFALLRTNGHRLARRFSIVP